MSVNERRSSHYYYPCYRFRVSKTSARDNENRGRGPAAARGVLILKHSGWGVTRTAGTTRNACGWPPPAPIVRHTDIVPTRTYTRSVCTRGARWNSADFERGRLRYIFHPLRVLCVCVCVLKRKQIARTRSVRRKTRKI